MLGELGWPGMDAFFFACCLGNLENIKGWPLGDWHLEWVPPSASDLLKHIFARRFSTKWLILILYGIMVMLILDVFMEGFKIPSTFRCGNTICPSHWCPKVPQCFQWFPPDVYRGEVEDLPHVGHGSNHSYLGLGLLPSMVIFLLGSAWVGAPLVLNILIHSQTDLFGDHHLSIWDPGHTCCGSK